MLSTPHATARSIPFQPLTVSKTRCRFHPNANCRLIKTLMADKRTYDHFSNIETRYCSVMGSPYFEWLLNKNENVKRRNLIDNTVLICGMQFYEVSGEKLHSVIEAGERDAALVKLVLMEVYRYLNNDKGDLNGNSAPSDENTNESKVYILLKNMYVDCLYSFRQCLIMPQELYCMYKEGEDPLLNKLFSYNTFPEFSEANASQDIYKSFIVYNTVLTMMLKEKNPFNDKTKVISKIIESVGTCNLGVDGAKKTHIKVCGLNFGEGTSPGHIMCPPKEMVKRIFHYAKWAQNPNGYRRYIDLIVQDSKQSDSVIREWQVFQNNFRDYFYPD